MALEAQEASEAQGKCIKPNALSAATNAKCHSSQQRANRFTARSALRKRRDISLVESLVERANFIGFSGFGRLRVEIILFK